MAKQYYFYSDEFGTYRNILQVKIITNGNSIFFVSLMSELEIHQSKGFISKDMLILPWKILKEVLVVVELR